MSKENKTSDKPQNGNDFITDVSKRYFLFSGQEDGKPTKYLVDDCNDSETAIAKIETEYPNFKWVMTETFNAC